MAIKTEPELELRRGIGTDLFSFYGRGYSPTDGEVVEIVKRLRKRERCEYVSTHNVVPEGQTRQRRGKHKVRVEHTATSDVLNSIWKEATICNSCMDETFGFVKASFIRAKLRKEARALVITAELARKSR